RRRARAGRGLPPGLLAVRAVRRGELPRRPRRDAPLPGARAGPGAAGAAAGAAPGPRARRRGRPGDRAREGVLRVAAWRPLPRLRQEHLHREPRRERPGAGPLRGVRPGGRLGQELPRRVRAPGGVPGRGRGDHRLRRAPLPALPRGGRRPPRRGHQVGRAGVRHVERGAAQLVRALRLGAHDPAAAPQAVPLRRPQRGLPVLRLVPHGHRRARRLRAAGAGRRRER
ncbi:unnamed protein product, partial [Prorocentrum cordatum]